ncbi:NAD(P)-dependent dehydrogenase (short-subunit alcohol dehydrogenase family) [Rhizobium pisi]
MARLSNTVAVVTGGGRGIGREIALQQAREGAKVAVLARTVTEIEETVSLIEGEARGSDRYFDGHRRPCRC